MQKISINTNEMEWEDARAYPSGAKMKVLSDGSDVAPRTILLKLPPDWRMESHSHIYTEQHYVLEGEYESENKTFSAGSFRVIPKEMDHGPFYSKGGALILVSWCELHK